MKLFYSPGSCSLAPHIVLLELGLPFELKKVDRAKKVDDGGDFKQINPKGYVPAIQLDDGRVLTEVPAINQYLADCRPDAELAPTNGSFERYRLQEWLSFINSEVHKQFPPLFMATTSEDAKRVARENLAKHFTLLNEALERNTYLLGEKFSVADAYLFAIVNWTNFIGFDLNPWPYLLQFQARIAARPAVQAALRAEGLLQ